MDVNTLATVMVSVVWEVNNKMSCKYCGFDGKCQINNPDDGIEHPGIDDEGYCVVESDPSPEDSCEEYDNDEN